MRGEKVKYWDGVSEDSVINTNITICDSCSNKIKPFVGEFFEIPPPGFYIERVDVFICQDCIDDFFFKNTNLLTVFMKFKKFFGEETFIDELLQNSKHFLPQIFNRHRRAIPKNIRERILKKYGFRCVSCESLEELSIDHIKPYSKGGTDKEGNLQVLCKSCNSKKGNKTTCG